MSSVPTPDWGHDVTPSHAGADGHRHGPSADADRRYLTVAFALIVGFMAVEIATAFAAGSLALLSDAGHMLTDAVAIGAAVFAARLAQRPPSGVWTYGLKRAEILSAAGNGVTLLVVAGVVTVEAVHRLVHPPAVSGLPVLAVALAGVAVNVAASWVLARADRRSLNIEGAFQHLLTDLYGFLATAAAGAVVQWVGWRRADLAASLFVVLLLLRAGWSLLRQAGRVLLQAAPEGVDLESVRQHMLETRHVRAVHDLHAWTVTSGLPVLSAHVVVDDDCLAEGRAAQLLDRLQECLVGHFDVEHSTLQIEPASHAGHEVGAHD